jgi:phosphoribosylanthranilate isomerase
MTWVKICGTTNLEDARSSLAAGADALGFIFAPSPRRVTPEQAGKMVAALPGGIETVGVFVNETEKGVVDTVRHAGLSAVQLHGDEPADFAHNLKTQLPAVKVLLAVPFASLRERASAAKAARDAIDALVVDGAPVHLRGGAGISFDWAEANTVLAELGPMKVVVAGGLTPDNVVESIRALHPWGVDVVSGVELSPGKKDPEKLVAFVRAVRACEKKVW